ncbi:hypothetical protein WA158_005569 [Blastocystis sp. Blastoise]
MDQLQFEDIWLRNKFVLCQQSGMFFFKTQYEFENNLLIQDFDDFLKRFLVSVFKFGIDKIEKKVQNMNFILPQCDSLLQCELSSFIDSSFLTIIRISFYLFFEYKQKQSFNQMKEILNEKMKLPIYEYREEILNTIRKNQITIISGDTGCGKSTQIPQYLYEDGYKHIVCTQPRRISTMSLCDRVRDETQFDSVHTVSYQIRFDSTENNNTRILYCTEGILIRKLLNSPIDALFDVLIVDEVHERHVTCDFLLGILSLLLPKFPRLKLVLMSATLDISVYKELFPTYKYIKIPGRMFPVDIQYCPLTDITIQRKTNDNELKMYTLPIDPIPYLRILQRIDELYDEDNRGDLLVFVSGYRDIQILKDKLEEYAEISKRWYILRLHSTLSREEQNKVFKLAPAGIRKCILSTNIAETSVTLPDIRFVVDSGKMKQLCLSFSSSTYTLYEYYISQSAANQRAGRAGRTGPGICFRMYSEEEYNNMNIYTEPEILRVPLEDLALQLLLLSHNNVISRDHRLLQTFQMMNTPSSEHIQRAYDILLNIGAIKNYSSMSLTSLGYTLALLPLSPTIGYICIYGSLFHLFYYAVVLAATLSVQSLYLPNKTTFNLNNSKNTVDSRGNIMVYDILSEDGDILTNINIIIEWIQLKNNRGNTFKWCRSHGINESSIYDCIELIKQYINTLKTTKILHLEDSMEMKNNKRKIQDYKSRSKRSLVHGVLTDADVYGYRNTVQNDEDTDEEEDNLDPSLERQSTLFSLSTNIQSLAHHLLPLNRKDSRLLGIFTAICLYPNLAISDPINISRKIPEYIYHSLFKKNLLLHPSSSLVRLLNKDQPSVDTYPFEHNVIVYEKIQESLHPYIYNALLLPAIHTLLLVSKIIDINVECNSILFDNWIYISIPNKEDFLYMLKKSQEIRRTLSIYISTSLPPLPQSSHEKYQKYSDKEHNNHGNGFISPHSLKGETKEISVMNEILHIYRDSYKPHYSNGEDIYNQLYRYINLDIQYSVQYITPSQVQIVLGRVNPYEDDDSNNNSGDSSNITSNTLHVDAISELEAGLNIQKERDTLLNSYHVNNNNMNDSKIKNNELSSAMNSSPKTISTDTKVSDDLKVDESNNILQQENKSNNKQEKAAFNADITSSSDRKGTQITPFIWFGSLVASLPSSDCPIDESEHIYKLWTCPICHQELRVNNKQMKQHIKLCKENNVSTHI